MTERYVAEAGLSGRVTTAVGDYVADPLPRGFDLVFMSAVVHSNGPSDNAALVAKAAGALDPGGRLAIVDWVMSPDRVVPTGGALFALNMLVATADGDTFTEAEIAGWLTGAGLADVSRVSTPFGTDIVMGRKR
jgi:SAM-dependent methyltransferase